MKRSYRAKCPPGVFCLSGNLATVIAVILGIALLFILCAMFFTKSNSPPTIVLPPQQPPVQNIISGESRYDRAPQPLRDWMMPAEFPPRGGIASIPINIPTQGLPESFQSVGLIQSDGGVLPLYGRRTMRGGDRWNYYTRTDTFNPVPVPIRFQRRDCMDDVGCQEILSGEHIKVEILGKEGTARMYRFDGPKYIPGLL
jgi:hypothetical protein